VVVEEDRQALQRLQVVQQKELPLPFQQQLQQPPPHWQHRFDV